MAAKSRPEWVMAAFSALCVGGIDAVRVEPLARDMGVTKGSFYHHFENRRALHLALLEEWEQLGTNAIINSVEAAVADPAERLGELVRQVFGSDPTSDAIETAIRAWASTDKTAAAATERVDGRRVEFVTQLLVGTGFAKPLARRRALVLYRNLIGEFTWRSSGGPASTPKELDEFTRLLLSSPSV